MAGNESETKLSPAEVFWSLFNQDTNRQCDGLSFNQVKFIVAHVILEDVGSWMYWHEGLDDWRPLKTNRELMDSKPALGRRSNLKTPKSPVDGSEADLRMTRRFQKKWPAQIEVKGHVIKTVTEDVAVNGIKFKDKIDLKKGDRITVLLQNGSQSLELLCVVVSGESESKTRVSILSAKHQESLRQWVVNDKKASF